MAFCTFCGKQIADGEVCTCQQSQTTTNSVPQGNTVPQGNIPQGMPYQAAPQAQSPKAEPSQVSNGFAEWGKFFVKSFKRPLEAAEDFFENGSIAASSISFIVLMLAYALTNLLYVVFRAVRGASYYAVHNYSYYYTNCAQYLKEVYGINFLSYVGGFFLPILWFVVMAGVTFGLACAINALFIKSKFNIKKIMSFCAAPTIGLMVTCLIQTIMYGINNSYGNILFRIIYHCVALLVLIQGMMNLKKLIDNRYKFLAAMGIGVAGLVLGNFIITSIINTFASNFITLPF